MATYTLAQELALIAYNDAGKRDLNASLDLGLAGAALLELALAGRLDVHDGKVVVQDATPTGDAIADAALQRIANDTKRRTPQTWVEKLQKGLRTEVLDSLVDVGVMERTEGKVLGLFPTHRFPTRNTAPETDVRARLDSAVLHGVSPDRRTAALISLISASGLRKAAFPNADRRMVESRMKAIAEGEWAGEAVRKAVQAVYAAIAAAGAVAAMAGTAGSSN
jgi:Golgi phosphoprotein 3 (GPP34)